MKNRLPNSRAVFCLSEQVEYLLVMKHAIMLALLGLAQLVLACNTGPLAWLLWWSGLSWIFAGCAYGYIGAKAFGKQTDGSMVWWIVLLFFPYLAVTWLVWHIQKALTKEPQCSQIAPGIWLGRRCLANELPPEIEMVVDLTAEFAESRQVGEGRVYICLPILDASIPSVASFQEVVRTAVDFDRPTYIHCALGHGRSAAVAIAVLVARGNASSIDQAELMVKIIRPSIAINAAQRHLLQQWQTRE